MKKLILFAGVNGAGKSTLYHTLYKTADMPRVNTDEIVKEFGDWRNFQDILTAGKIAVKRIDDFLECGETFNQETTLCGKGILKQIKRAKRLGYYIELHYVGVDSVDIAKERVLMRVKQGGHGISETDIIKRYTETFNNLKIVLPECNLVSLYDNTTDFRRFAIYKDAQAVMVSKNVPQWYIKFLEKE